MNTQTTIAGVTFKNPVMTASGTFGSGMEYEEFVDLNRLGAVVTKGVANVPWPGNPTPRVAEVYGGMLNAIGLQNPGIDVFMERDIPFLKKYDTKIIVNVCGKTVEDYVDVVERLGDEPAVSMLEINVSCPNVKEGAIAFGQKADALYNITSELKNHAKQPIIMKLSPNVTDITEMAKAAGGSRRRCPVPDQYHHRYEDRHSPQKIRHCQQDRRHERPCHQTHRCPYGLSGGTGGTDPHYRYGRYCHGGGCHRIYPGRCQRRQRRSHEFCGSLYYRESSGGHRGLHAYLPCGESDRSDRCSAVRYREQNTV